MFDVANRTLAAVWACFAPSDVSDIALLDSTKRVLAASWTGFASNGLVEAWRWFLQNVLWLQPGHVLRPTQLSI